MKLKIMAVALICLLSVGCSDGREAKRVLEKQGYTNITPDGYAWLSCSDDDIYKTHFRATAPNGEKVTGAVCAGIFKGSTVRLD